MNAVVGAILLLVPAAPFVLLLFRPAFLRRLTMFPRAFFLITTGLAAYLVSVMLVARFFPQWLPWLVALMALPAIYLLWWRALPNFGTSRGLPPGSLQLAPSGPWRDFLFYQKQAERYGPVFKMNNFIAPMICVHGIERGNEFLKQHEASTATPPMPFNRHVPRGFMRYMAPAVHLEYRHRMKAIFSDRRLLEQKAASTDRTVGACLAAMAKEPAGVSPVAFIEDMTFALFADLFFGVSPDDPELARLRELYRRIDYRRGLFASRSGTERRLEEIEAVLLTHAVARPGYFSDFLGPPAPDRLQRASDKTLLRNFIYLLQTSWIDVSDLVAWTLWHLCRYPRWLESLKSGLRATDPSLVDRAHDLAHRVVVETLRLEQSEYLMRKALRDLRFDGFLIPKGWLVRIGIRESHRDGEIYDRPHEFDPDRFLARSYGIRQYSPFGMQQKSCLGQGLTQATAERFVLALARGYRCTAVQDGPRELGAFHWRPSARFRVLLSPDPAAGSAESVS